MSISDRIYSILRPLTIIVPTGAAVVLGAHYNPIPITSNWGNLAARDMAAKKGVIEEVKRRVREYTADGRLSSTELQYIIALTDARVFFLNHRIQEAEPILGMQPRFGHETPLASDFDELLTFAYNDMVRIDSQNTSLLDYSRMRNRLRRELYNMFVNRDKVTYEEWCEGRGFERQLRGETNTSWLSRNFRGSLDLRSSDLENQLIQGLDILTDYVSSPQNQARVRNEIGSEGRARNRTYNGLAFGAAALLATKLTRHRRRKSNRTSR